MSVTKKIKYQGLSGCQKRKEDVMSLLPIFPSLPLSLLSTFLLSFLSSYQIHLQSTQFCPALPYTIISYHINNHQGYSILSSNYHSYVQHSWSLSSHNIHICSVTISPLSLSLVLSPTLSVLLLLPPFLPLLFSPSFSPLPLLFLLSSTFSYLVEKRCHKSFALLRQPAPHNRTNFQISLQK